MLSQNVQTFNISCQLSQTTINNGPPTTQAERPFIPNQVHIHPYKNKKSTGMYLYNKKFLSHIKTKHYVQASKSFFECREIVVQQQIVDAIFCNLFSKTLNCF